MPVSTRSHIINPQTNPNPEQQDTQLRNPHHGLKEKMKALTLLYEQQKQASAALKNPTFNHEVEEEEEPPSFSTHPNVALFNSGKKELKETKPMRENSMPNSPVTQFTCGRVPTNTNTNTTVARKLSMTMPPHCSHKENQQDHQLVEVADKEGSRILVFVRLRPMERKDKEGGARCCVKIVNKRDVYLTEFANENDYLRLKRVRGRHFKFDASFPESTTQHEVYSTTTVELVEAVLQGRNGSVFCYGATGAGKTYTMLGTVENPGVMVLAIKDLFNKIRQRSFGGNHEVHLSYLEVYNETVRDLLSPGRPLVLREDKQGIVASGLTQYRAYSTDEVMALLQQGNQNRTTEPTRANETSSRSHAILQVLVEYCFKDALGNVVNRVGKLSLIDLAGSERALATDQRTLRSLEGANINRSLLALSSCIHALVEGKKHIPYRNSKLTQLLKDSLGGACNTVMIANISPSNLTFGETQNTLHWADRAKAIRTKAGDRNEERQIPESETDQAKLLLELQKENRELRMQLARQQQKLLTLQAQTLAANASPAPPCTGKEKRKARPSLLSGNCFTPESNKKGADETVKELRKTVRLLETEMERMKKDHAVQTKQKDDFIRQLSRQVTKAEGAKSGVGVVTRNSSGEVKSPSHRFLSPAPPAAKKRSFWDITTGNSPSVVTSKGRKTRSHVTSGNTAAAAAAAPSMLLQPGFTRQRRPETVKL